jgi:Spy/CpxP family protein refolding chaperone
MNKTQAAALALVAVLSTGAFLDAGFALAQQTDPGNSPTPVPWPCPRGGMGRGGWSAAGDRTQAHLDRMAWRLSLTAEQKAKLEPILRQREETRAAQRQAMRNEIAALLTPDQLAQFDRMGPGPVRTAAPAGGIPAVQP